MSVFFAETPFRGIVISTCLSDSLHVYSPETGIVALHREMGRRGRAEGRDVLLIYVFEFEMKIIADRI